MAIDIPMFDTASFIEEIALDGIPYRLRVRYNYRGGFWAIDILDRDENVLVAGVKLVTNYEVIRRFRYRNVPPGALFAANTTEPNSRLDRFSFITNATLTYLLENELGSV